MDEKITLTTEEYNNLMSVKEKYEGQEKEIARLVEANNTLTREKTDLQRAFLNGNFSKNEVQNKQQKQFKDFLGDIKK